MAGLSDATQQRVANLTPEQLQRLLALVQGSAGTSNNSTDFGQWTGSGDLAGFTVDRRRDVIGSSPSGPDQFGAPRTRIYGNASGGAWDVQSTDVWDDQGNYIGPSSGDSTNLGLAKFIAASVGGYYAAGAANGLEAAAPEALGEAGGYGFTSTETGLTQLGDAGLTNASAAGGGSTTGAWNGTDFGGSATSNGSTAASGSGAAKTGAGLAATNGWESLARIGAGAVVSGVTAETMSDPVDTSRFDQLFDAMITEQTRNSNRSEDMWQNYLATFRPLEQKLATAAANYDTPERRDRAATEAVGLVSSSYDQQRQEAERDMVRAGLDPSTIQALGASSRLTQAKDEAGAANKARRDTEATGLNLVNSVANFGRGNANLGLQAANTATANTSVANSAATTGANAQNQNTQYQNSIFGSVLGTLTNVYGMGLFDAKPGT
jgi:hypothetical protein